MLQSRSGEFREFLERHFRSVTAITPSEFSESLTAEHAVTLFDALPEPISERHDGGFSRDRFLSDEYAGAALCIGSITWRLFGRMGTGGKLDHL